jgi:hypothetical protein
MTANTDAQSISLLTGAAASHVASGSDMRHVVAPLVLALLVVASWAVRPRTGG